LQRVKKKYKYIGYFVISLSIILNQFVIRVISVDEIKIEETEKQIILFIIQILFFLFGLYILRFGKSAIQNLTTLLVSLFFTFSVLELSLVWLFPFNIKSSSPGWIPYHKFIDNESRINKFHEFNSKKNIYSFNDINHTYKKCSKNLYRIAILGDSFIWGDGVEDSVIWSRKLEKKLQVFTNQKFEVFHWGYRGMSTLQQYNFFLTEGYKYDIDLLILGFVVNDPDMGERDLTTFIHYNSKASYLLRKTLFYFFPNSLDFLTYYINNFANQYLGYGYVNWLENYVYSDESIAKYSKTIRNFDKLLKKNNIPYIIVMTPESHNPMLEKYFNKITPIFEKYKIRYLNLFPTIKSHFRAFSFLELATSPANAHPGPLVTTVYAEEVYKYLLTNNLLKISLSNE